jgi:hypothetical protein
MTGNFLPIESFSLLRTEFHIKYLSTDYPDEMKEKNDFIGQAQISTDFFDISGSRSDQV